MKKPLLCLFLLMVLACIALVSSFHSSMGQVTKEVKGILDSNTAWTKGNSPYMLTGPILVNSGVTLTIEPGVTVNLGSYYIQVNGTLNAIGTTKDNIHFNGGGGTLPGAIAFTSYSPNGCSTIENAVINASNSIAIGIGDTSPKINNNTIYGIIWAAASTPTGEPLKSSTPIITNNNLIAKNGEGSVLEMSTSPIIANNTIKGDIRADSEDVIISGNYIEGSVVSNGQIISNFLSGCGGGNGIQAGFGGIIDHNLITNYDNAIELGRGASPIIRNNTIINNVNAVSVSGYIKSSYNPQIYWNNIYNNSGYSINLYMSETYPTSNINATCNWWGTTNTQAINEAIHDNADDYNLGTVNFVPILTELNPQAMPNITVLTPLPSSYPTPNASGATSQNPVTPNQPISGESILFGLDWVEVAIAVLLAVIAVLLVVVVVFLRRRSVG